MHDRPDNIVLIGFASTGKTAVGKALAEQLGRPFIDLDDRVEVLHVAERGVQRRCRDIYSLLGRQCFVDFETRALQELSTARGAIIALGGGTPVDPINRDLARNLGWTVYLKASANAVFERMKIKGFPRYLGENPTPDALTALMEERGPIYKETADVIIDNTRLSPAEAAEAVRAAVAKRLPALSLP